MPAHDALVAMLTAARSTPLPPTASGWKRPPNLRTLRVLPDNFLMIGQAIVVEKGRRRRSLDEVNRFIAEVRASGFVKSSLERAKLAGVEVAPAAKR